MIHFFSLLLLIASISIEAKDLKSLLLQATEKVVRKYTNNKGTTILCICLDNTREYQATHDPSYGYGGAYNQEHAKKEVSSDCVPDEIVAEENFGLLKYLHDRMCGAELAQDLLINPSKQYTVSLSIVHRFEKQPCEVIENMPQPQALRLLQDRAKAGPTDTIDIADMQLSEALDKDTSQTVALMPMHAAIKMLERCQQKE